MIVVAAAVLEIGNLANARPLSDSFKRQTYDRPRDFAHAMARGWSTFPEGGLRTEVEAWREPADGGLERDRCDGPLKGHPSA